MSGFSFLNSWALALSVLTPLLILAYLNRAPQREKIVSSLILLRKLPKAPAIRERVRLPPLFFLELIILLLLAFLAAYPIYSIRGARVAVVLDNSLSMSAKGKSGSRLDQGVFEISRWLDLQAAQDKFTLYLPSPELTKISDELISASDLKSALRKVKASSAPDLLDGTISQLVSTGKYDKIFVASDKERALTGAGSNFPVDTRTIGDALSNSALVNLRFDRKSMNVIAAIATFNPEPVRGKLKAYSGSQLIAETALTLEPKRIVEARLAAGRGVGDVLRIELIPEGADSIQIDNVGYLNVGAIEAKNILLVSDMPAEGGDLGLASLGADSVSSSGYSELAADKIAQYQTVIFHRVSPGRAPQAPILFISPPIDSGIIPGRSEVTSPTISSWKTESALTSYINFPLIRLPKAVVLSIPAWGEPIVSVEQGPVVVAGEREGFRTAAIGFEILPFEGRKTPTISILTLNVLGWLSGGAQFEETLRTGAPLPLPLKNGWKLSFPTGERFSSESDNETPRASAPGVYTISSGLYEKKIIVNAFHPDESATNERGFYEANYPVEQTTRESSENSFWKTILNIILGLIAIDLLIRAFLALRVKNA